MGNNRNVEIGNQKIHELVRRRRKINKINK